MNQVGTHKRRLIRSWCFTDEVSEVMAVKDLVPESLKMI
jgi:hypothetical protein